MTTGPPDFGERSARPYANSAEHLGDVLGWLTLRLKLEVFRHRNRQPEGTPDGLRGVLISEEEVDRVLAVSSRLWDGGSEEVGDESAPAPAPAPEFDTGLVSDALDQLDARIKARREASRRVGVPLTPARLAMLFGLSPLEERCVLIALAPELDRGVGTVYAYLQDDLTRRRPCVDFLLGLLLDSPAERWAGRAVFGARAALRRHQLVALTGDSVSGPSPLSERTVFLDDRVTDFLLGVDSIDERLVLSVSPVEIAEEPGPGEDDDRLIRFVSKALDDGRSVLISLSGPPGVGNRATAARVARGVGLGLLAADLGRLAATSEPLGRIGREARLRRSAICLSGLDDLPAEGRATPASEFVFAIADDGPMLTFILSRDPWRPDPERSPRDLAFLAVEVKPPDESARELHWLRRLPEVFEPGTVDEAAEARVLAGKFRFTPAQIKAACRAAADLARWRDPSGVVVPEDLIAACRARTASNADAAIRVSSVYTWHDIVLPEDRLRQLRELCHAVSFRAIVHGAWGFGRKHMRGGGVAALFAGPSGTGKTMAAEIVARELGLELRRIDLSVIVSKYIGETEKNLSRIFDGAEASNAVLLFDEADALFGKRSEVKDAHDRYANIEVGYLLQKMEAYQGVVILASNLRKNMDDAFVRRLQFVIEFPFPAEADRKRIWQGVWPADAPLGPDLDLDLLARRYELTGGNIRNIAEGAAFLAASGPGGGPIALTHVLQATRREYQKTGKVIMGDEFGETAGRNGR